MSRKHLGLAYRPACAPLSAVTNMPQSDSSRSSSFHEMAITLSNMVVPIRTHPFGKELYVPVIVDDDAQAGVNKAKIVAWSEDVHAQDLGSMSLPPDFTNFSFPPQSGVDYLELEGDPEVDVILNSGPVKRHPNLPKASYLFTLEEIHRKAYIPPLIIRLHDVAGKRRLTSKQDGFMYYDPRVSSLESVISRRSVAVHCNDAILDDHIYFANHAVRVFVEVLTLPGLHPDQPGARSFKFIGDYYLHKTRRTLPKEEWDTVPEPVKNLFVQRYIDNVVTPLDDPNPGNRYSGTSVRRWYDRGGILPLIILRQAYKTYDAGSEHQGDCASMIELNCDPEVESEYSQDSAPHDIDTALCFFQPPTPANVQPKDRLPIYPNINRTFRFPQPMSVHQDSSEGSQAVARRLAALDSAKAHRIMAAIADLRWKDGLVCWRLLAALEISSIGGGVRVSGYPSIPSFSEAGLRFWSGPEEIAYD